MLDKDFSKKDTITKIWIILILAYFFLNICQQFNLSISIKKSTISLIYIFISSLSLLLIVLRTYMEKKVKVDMFSVYLISFYFWSLISYIVNISHYNYSNGMISAIDVSFWALFYLVCKQRINKINLFSYFFKSINVFLLLISIFYIYCMLIMHYEAYSYTKNTVYYIVMALPVVYIIENRNIKYLTIILAISAILVSNKRTAFLAASFGILLPLIIDSFMNKKRKRAFGLFGILVVAVILYYVFYTISNIFGLNVINRFQLLSADEGSGRGQIYRIVFREFQSSSIFNKIIGHGFNSVYYSNICGTSAHNDFLEILYDYGYVGLFLYFLSIIYFLIHIIRLIKKHDVRTPFVISSFSIFMIMSLISHLIIYPTYIAFYLINYTYGTFKMSQPNLYSNR